MKKIELEEYTAFIFYDGSVRIESLSAHLCLDLSDIDTSFFAAHNYMKSMLKTENGSGLEISYQNPVALKKEDQFGLDSDLAVEKD